ncbi:MAG: MFS transporter [Actinomycetota bacterium]
MGGLEASITRFSPDAIRIFGAQTLRAFGYGLGAVLLGSSLEARGLTPGQVGGFLAAVVAGTVLAQIVVGRRADRWGRRRAYLALHLALAVAGIAFSFDSPLWLLIPVVLTGALSTEVIESGPFTSIEQAMLAGEFRGRQLARGFGWYNAVAAAAGSLGALAAGLSDLTVRWWPHERWFLALTGAAIGGGIIASGLSPRVESARAKEIEGKPLDRSRLLVGRLAGLFALDSFGGGFVVQSFVAYWLAVRFDATTSALGLLFFGLGILQTVSFLLAPLLADRFGLLNTMVFTHLPSNFLLAGVAFAPNLAVAIGFLLARTTLSQMDVPTRQAYLMALVDPVERTAAAAFTNTARYLVRPFGPSLAGAALAVAPGFPFLAAGGIKIVYDLLLWRWFRRVPLESTPPS